MRNPDAKTLNRALVLVLDKHVKQAAVCKQLDLTHSQVEDAGMLWLWLCVAKQRPLDLTPEVVATMRDLYGCSWGRIAAMSGTRSPGLPVCKVPASKVRRMYEDHTGIASVAQRIGKGGRYYANDADLYADELHPTGTYVPVGDLANANAHASRQRLLAKDLDDLRAMADEAGVSYTKRTTKAKLVHGLANLA